MDKGDILSLRMGAEHHLGFLPGLTTTSETVFYNIKASTAQETPELKISQSENSIRTYFANNFDEFDGTSFETGEFSWKVNGVVDDEFTSLINVNDDLQSFINNEGFKNN
jgi:hypothetical protein